MCELMMEMCVVQCARVYVFWVCVLGVCCEVSRVFAGLCYECAYRVCGVQ